MTGSPSFPFSIRARKTVAQPIGELMAMGVEREDLISLAAGLVDYPTLPSDEVATIVSQVLSAPGRAGKIPLQYGTTEGNAALRQTLLEHLAALDGVETAAYGASAEDVVISSGSQQLLFLLTDVLVDPGDIVITARPSYFVYTGALAGFGAQVRTVPVDEGGMDPEALGALLAELDASKQLQRVKILYLQPDHQNPTGLSLAADRRGRIVEILKRYSYDHRILLIEDA
ncbi:MAG: aminotransferase class I/II-fold pyridoxal phosphate-dependent enzyme, partial [Phycisphaeraceae bacterium]|nr:aminotransferase class I/II-fold pyridoxal phosphate-dependent enzyme [Phycisphaeraceae bacterium]